MADLTPALPGFEPGARRVTQRQHHRPHRPPRTWVAEWCTCAVCDKTFPQRWPGQKYCSERCKNQRPRKPKSQAARARDNKRKRIRPPQACGYCGTSYRPTNGKGDRKYCSRDCYADANRKGPKRWPASRVHPACCAECSRSFSSRTKRATCGKECQRKQTSKQVSARIQQRYRIDPAFRDRVIAKAHARRADKLGLGSKTVLLSYLIKRDRGLCQIPACVFKSRKVAPLGSKGPRKPSIDHIVPLNKGGTHELSNVQLGHARCNSTKQDRGGGDQLRLVG